MEYEGIEQEILLEPENAIVGAVYSVNGKTGDVVLTTSDLENDSDYQTGDEVDAAIATAIAGKQDTLTAGNNIQISAENVISATDTTYSAGNGLNLSSENAFSVDTTVVATQQNLATEVQNRENADNALQAQIDGISASSDVVDIVGTYADLQNYDTSKLKDNDIIKVLQDETQNDATTYYRWSTTTETFTLIGQEGPYYTKAAADAQFVPQTRTVNGKALNNNITLNASDVNALGTSDVVQTTGSSTSQVMSQNATTQALSTKLNITDYVVDDELKNSTNPVQNGVLYGLLGNMPTDFFSGNATTEQTGTEAQFTNALKISDIELNGDTFQQTYQGYNLVDLVPITNSSISYSQSVTTETVMDSTLGRNVLHIVATGGYPTVTYNLPTSFEMGKYYSFKITYRTTTAGPGSAANEFWFGFNTVGNTWDNLALFNVGVIDKGADGDTSRFFNASDTWVTKSKRFYANPSVLTSADAFKRVQLSFGYGPGLNGVTAKEAWIADVQVYEITEAEWNADTYTSKDYEPYTGSTSTQITPSPNPDYPQDIQVVTGEQTVNVHGKNLAKTTNCNISGTGYSMKITNGHVDLSTQSHDGYFDLCSGTRTGQWAPSYSNAPDAHITEATESTYTISWQDFNITGSTASTSLYVFTNQRQVVVATRDSAMPGTRTITLASGEYIKSFGVWTNGVNTDSSLKFNPQIEQGSTATTYEPYQSQDYTVNLGSLELCKIGNYQDYIYKSGDDWYVHKETASMVFDGSENWSSPTSFNLTNTNVYYLVTTFTCKDPVMSSHFRSSSYIRTADVSGICGTIWDLPAYRISNTVVTSVAEWQTWLSTHNMATCYVLKTPTDTKITDSTLIGQLNALYNAKMLAGQTNFAVSAVSPNLPAILDITVFNANAQGIIASIRGN